MANSDCELVSFYSTVKETLNCLSEFNVGKKEAVSMLVPGKDLLTMLPTSFWIGLIFQGWYL